MVPEYEVFPAMPLDDQGPFMDLDRIRIDMLNEGPPADAEKVFGAGTAHQRLTLARLQFFRWVLHDLYGGSMWEWEASLERRDERLAGRTSQDNEDGPYPIRDEEEVPHNLGEA